MDSGYHAAVASHPARQPASHHPKTRSSPCLLSTPPLSFKAKERPSVCLPRQTEAIIVAPDELQQRRRRTARSRRQASRQTPFAECQSPEKNSVPFATMPTRHEQATKPLAQHDQADSMSQTATAMSWRSVEPLGILVASLLCAGWVFNQDSLRPAVTRRIALHLASAAMMAMVAGVNVLLHVPNSKVSCARCWMVFHLLRSSMAQSAQSPGLLQASTGLGCLYLALAGLAAWGVRADPLVLLVRLGGKCVALTTPLTFA
jgi:hypothetical protein